MKITITNVFRNTKFCRLFYEFLGSKEAPHILLEWEGWCEESLKVAIGLKENQLCSKREKKKEKKYLTLFPHLPLIFGN